MREDTKQAVLDFLANGKTGVSSETMAFYLGFGIKKRNGDVPHDPSDFNRCLRLLKAAPELRSEIPKLKSLSKAWKGIADAWSAIETKFMEEAGFDFEYANCAPETYRLIKQAIHKK